MSNDAYLGNPNLKKVNTPVEFTKENIQDLKAQLAINTFNDMIDIDQNQLLLMPLKNVLQLLFDQKSSMILK